MPGGEERVILYKPRTSLISFSDTQSEVFLEKKGGQLSGEDKMPLMLTVPFMTKYFPPPVPHQAQATPSVSSSQGEK
jgi:hypothetical protein